jgi:hypothetical protein
LRRHPKLHQAGGLLQKPFPYFDLVEDAEFREPALELPGHVVDLVDDGIIAELIDVLHDLIDVLDELTDPVYGIGKLSARILQALPDPRDALAIGLHVAFSTPTRSRETRLDLSSLSYLAEFLDGVGREQVRRSAPSRRPDIRTSFWRGCRRD